MSRPAFIVCDTDATIQFLLAKEVRPLQLLRLRYSIQPIIVPEVEIELQSSRKFGKRISHELTKGLSNGLLLVLNRGVLEEHYGGAAASMAAGAALEKISSTGDAFYTRVDYGEAYTHAAALTLGAPALSHDRSALDALHYAGWQVPKTVLRAFDLVALACQLDEMTTNECDRFRAFLEREGEFIPGCFRRTSFVSGLSHFCPRLIDTSAPRIGTTSCAPTAYSSVVYL